MHPFPKIPQFRHVLHSIKMNVLYDGDDENGNPIYVEEGSRELPTISVQFTIKLHGTNAAIVMDQSGKLWTQSRNNRFDPMTQLDSHQGFTAYVRKNKDFYKDLLSRTWADIGSTTDSANGGEIVLFGEWAGQGIQNGVGISELPKAFYAFALVTGTKEKRVWHDMSTSSHLPLSKSYPENDFHNVYSYDCWYFDIDMNNPEKVLKEISKLVEDIDSSCPISKKLGKEGHGEGLVGSFYYNRDRYMFKVKGDSHKKGGKRKKVKIELSPAHAVSIDNFVERTVTEERVLQAVQQTEASGKKDTGKVINWVSKDVLTEELDILFASGLDWKQVKPKVLNRAREIFFSMPQSI